jgi:glycosyltransferase involved in cell wall biosynthesis
MKVSIITVCFNSAATIRDTIESVLEQNYPNIDYLIIDGGSTDETLSIISEYDSRIATIISERDLGIYDAMNKGIHLASGEIIGILNSDDIYMDKNSVTQLVAPIVEGKSESTFADLIVVSTNDLNKVVRYYDSSYFSPAMFRFGWMPAHPTFFVKKSCYALVGDYSLDYKIAADYEMLIRLLSIEGISYTYIPKPLIKMRFGGASSANLGRVWRLNCEIVHACRRNGIWTMLPLLLLKLPKKLAGRFFKRKFK